MKMKDTTVAAFIIVTALGILFYFSFGAGYRFGTDMAVNENESLIESDRR